MDKQELPALPEPSPIPGFYDIEARKACVYTADQMLAFRDAALTAQSAEIARLRDALLHCARLAEALKLPCGDDDPESPQVIRNGQYQNISLTAHIALGTIRGPAAPSEADEVARLTAELRESRVAAGAFEWAYRYLQDRMRSIDRPGWAEDCDGEIEWRIAAAQTEHDVAMKEQTNG